MSLPTIQNPEPTTAGDQVFYDDQQADRSVKQQGSIERASNYDIVPMFPCPVYISGEKFPVEDGVEGGEQAKQGFREFVSNETLGQYKNGMGNIISENTHILDRPELSNLKDYIQKNLNTYAHEVMRIQDSCEFYITQSWINFNKKGMWHLTHTHQNSIISGCFYIAGGNCPITFFHSSSPRFGMGGGFDFQYKDHNIYNSQSWWLNNENGRVVIFPSWVQHQVAVNTHEETRISLAWNTFFKGSVGDRRSLTELLMNNQFD